MLEIIKINTEFQGVHDITKEVNDVVAKSGIKDGICVISCPHTTSGLIITSFWDKRGHTDMQKELGRMVPARANYLHQFDTPFDAAGHIKSSLMGCSVSCIVKDGKATHGSSQGIFFIEFDGPRSREYWVKVIEG